MVEIQFREQTGLYCHAQLRQASKGLSKTGYFGSGGKVSGQYTLVVQRLYSMFPPGIPGVALLVLRCTIGVGFYSIASPAGSGHPIFLCFLILLGLGLFTPIFCVLVSVVAMVGVMHDPGGRLFEATLLLTASLSYALIGPGAYSVDGVIFGRRKLISSGARRNSR